jgi:hypothetical protein
MLISPTLNLDFTSDFNPLDLLSDPIFLYFWHIQSRLALRIKEPRDRQVLGLFYFVPPIGGDMGNRNLKVGGFSPPFDF